jgi:hypothetical protein
MADPVILEKIDQYLDGKLSDTEAEHLWEVIIQHPGYVEYLETMKTLRETRSGTNMPN